MVPDIATLHPVHQSGDLEVLLEKNKVIPPIAKESS